MIGSSHWIVNTGTLVLAVAAVASAVLAAITLRASNRVLDAATKQATATEQLAKVTAAAYVESSLPLLADVPQHRRRNRNAPDKDIEIFVESGLGDNYTISIPIRNVGMGAAFMKNAYFDSIDGHGGGVPAAPAHHVVISGETTLILTSKHLPVDPGDRSLDEILARQFRVVVYYTNFSGDRNRQTVLYVSALSSQGRFIRDVDVHECDVDWNIVGSPVLAKRN